MKFIMVNLPKLSGDPFFCEHCGDGIGYSYVRCLCSLLVFCDVECYMWRMRHGLRQIEDRRHA